MKKLLFIFILISIIHNLPILSYSDEKKEKKEEEHEKEKHKRGWEAIEKKYKHFENPQVCGGCHPEFFEEWKESKHSKSFTNSAFQTMYKHALSDLKDNKEIKEDVDRCILCHSPSAYYAGDIPPTPDEDKLPERGIMCDFCHTVEGIKDGLPHNGNFINNNGPDIDPKRGPWKDAKSPYHQTIYSELHTRSEFCGACHNQKNIPGVWVQETYNEWKASKWAKDGYQCQDCHMMGEGRSHPIISKEFMKADAREKVVTHRLPGFGSQHKISDAVNLKVSANKPKAQLGEELLIKVSVTNAKVGHTFPSGTPNLKQLWLVVNAIDSKKRTPVLIEVKKEDAPLPYNATSNEPAYKDIERDALPEGNRIYHSVFYDRNNQHTYMSYEAAKIAFDNRLKAGETRVETYRWKIPADTAVGEIIISATLNYRSMPQSLADFLEIGEIPVTEVAYDEVSVFVVK
jgi:hypothetical protein